MKETKDGDFFLNKVDFTLVGGTTQGKTTLIERLLSICSSLRKSGKDHILDLYECENTFRDSLKRVAVPDATDSTREIELFSATFHFSLLDEHLLELLDYPGEWLGEAGNLKAKEEICQKSNALVFIYEYGKGIDGENNKSYADDLQKALKARKPSAKLLPKELLPRLYVVSMADKWLFNEILKELEKEIQPEAFFKGLFSSKKPELGFYEFFAILKFGIANKLIDQEQLELAKENLFLHIEKKIKENGAEVSSLKEHFEKKKEYEFGSILFSKEIKSIIESAGFDISKFLFDGEDLLKTVEIQWNDFSVGEKYQILGFYYPDRLKKARENFEKKTVSAVKKQCLEILEKAEIKIPPSSEIFCMVRVFKPEYYRLLKVAFQNQTVITDGDLAVLKSDFSKLGQNTKDAVEELFKFGDDWQNTLKEPSVREAVYEVIISSLKIEIQNLVDFQKAIHWRFNFPEFDDAQNQEKVVILNSGIRQKFWALVVPSAYASLKITGNKTLQNFLSETRKTVMVSCYSIESPGLEVSNNPVNLCAIEDFIGDSLNVYFEYRKFYSQKKKQLLLGSLFLLLIAYVVYFIIIGFTDFFPISEKKNHFLENTCVSFLNPCILRSKKEAFSKKENELKSKIKDSLTRLMDGNGNFAAIEDQLRKEYDQFNIRDYLQEGIAEHFIDLSSRQGDLAGLKSVASRECSTKPFTFFNGWNKDYLGKLKDEDSKAFSKDFLEVCFAASIESILKKEKKFKSSVFNNALNNFGSEVACSIITGTVVNLLEEKDFLEQKDFIEDAGEEGKVAYQIFSATKCHERLKGEFDKRLRDIQELEDCEKIKEKQGEMERFFVEKFASDLYQTRAKSLSDLLGKLEEQKSEVKNVETFSKRILDAQEKLKDDFGEFGAAFMGSTEWKNLVSKIKALEEAAFTNTYSELLKNCPDPKDESCFSRQRSTFKPDNFHFLTITKELFEEKEKERRDSLSGEKEKQQREKKENELSTALKKAENVVELLSIWNSPDNSDYKQFICSEGDLIKQYYMKWKNISKTEIMVKFLKDVKCVQNN